MKFLNNKGFTQKLIIVLIIVILFNFSIPIRSEAAWDWTGKLFEPIADFICGIGDAAINLLQSVFFPYSPKAVDKRSAAEIERGESFGFFNMEPAAMTMAGGVLAIIGEGFNNSFLQGAGQELLALYAEVVLPYIRYGPGTIFSNQIPAFDINFINPSIQSKEVEQKELEYQIEALKEEKEDLSLTDFEDNIYIMARIASLEAALEELESSNGNYEELNTAYVLRPTIATWYIALRNIAIIGLLCVLVFIAIRIIISSVGEDKAKYKSMLKDWLIAICLLFFMHYFMAFILKIIELITDAFPIILDGRDTVMEYIRTAAASDDYMQKMGYAILYVVLIFYTIIFTWKYFKRTIYMAFLTIISPLVALTYPIDKIKDGQAQAFSMWMREYIFNALLQPMHLLLYYILVVSAADLVEQNVIYALIAIGFLLPAEKIIRKFFGFNNAEGGGLGAGAALTGGAVFATAANFLKSRGNSSNKGGGNGSGGSSDGNSGKIRYERSADSDAPKGLDAFKVNNAGGDSDPKNPPTNVRQMNLDNLKLKPANRNKIPKLKPNSTLSNGKRPLMDLKSPTLTGAKIQKKTGTNTPSRKKRTLRLKKTPVGRVASGFKNMAYTGVKQLPKMAKFAGKTGIKLASAATLGSIGLAAGLASEDDSDAIKYALLGASAGYIGAGGIMNKMGNMGSKAGDVADTFKRGYYGDEYKEKVLNKRLDKEWEKNAETYYKDKYGSQYKEKMEIGRNLRSQGISDQKEIDAATKLIDKNPGLTVQQAAGVMNFTKGLNKTDLLNKDTRSELEEQARQMTGSKEMAKRVMGLADQKFEIVNKNRMNRTRTRMNRSNPNNSENNKENNDNI